MTTSNSDPFNPDPLPDPFPRLHTITTTPRCASGEWGVFCEECSQAVRDYVYPCAQDRWGSILPPKILYEQPAPPEEYVALRQRIQSLYEHAVHLSAETVLVRTDDLRDVLK